MFRAGQPNPYDDIVAKTTDENLTTENWELIITLCDKVNDEGEQGARNVIAALIKRLAHRTSNVQLYALALAEALSKNCGVEVHREIASRAFCQSLEKLITDRMTHDRVRKKALSLIAMWVTDYEDNSSLGMIEETYQSLKAKNYKFDQAPEVPPPQVDDEVRRKEEEELQRALEMSIRDKGGRDQWSNYVAASSSGAGGSGAGSSSDLYQPQVSSQPTAGPAASKFKPASTAYRAQSPQTSHAPAQPGSPMSTTSSSALTRVRALHNFEPTQPGELAFQKGDIIRVIGKEYENWWKGQLKARVGIFPVNYVEVLPEPTAADIQKEAEQEANVFTQAANIDRLLALLRGIDPIKDNLADNEEISELYHHSVALRPKIVKLIDKYSQKRAQLVEIEESFLKARTMYDQMIEDSLARHTGAYDGRASRQQMPQDPRTRTPGFPGVNPMARPGTGFGWNPNIYEQPGYNGPPAGYPEQAYPPGVADPQAHAPYPQANVSQPQPQPQQQPQPQPNTFPMPASQNPNGYPQQSYQAPSQPAPAQQQVPQPQPVQAAQPAAAQPLPEFQSGPPPYIYNPNGRYDDKGAQDWAQYYAQGGTDKSGLVYFKHVPGVSEVQPEPVPTPAAPVRQDSYSLPSPQHGPPAETQSLPPNVAHIQRQASLGNSLPQPDASGVAAGSSAPYAGGQPGFPNPGASQAAGQWSQPQQQQPGSPGGYGSQQYMSMQPTASGQYPPNPYPLGGQQQAAQPSQPQPQGGAGNWQDQYGQMQSHFAGMSVQDGHPQQGGQPAGVNGVTA